MSVSMIRDALVGDGFCEAIVSGDYVISPGFSVRVWRPGENLITVHHKRPADESDQPELLFDLWEIILKRALSDCRVVVHIGQRCPVTAANHVCVLL